MPKLKTYKIGVYEERGGYLVVKALSKKSAIIRAEKALDDYGLDKAYLPTNMQLLITHCNDEVLGDVEEMEEIKQGGTK